MAIDYQAHIEDGDEKIVDALNHFVEQLNAERDTIQQFQAFHLMSCTPLNLLVQGLHHLEGV